MMVSTSRAPTMAEVIREALEARLAGVHVCLPARVEKVGVNGQTVDVKPVINNLIKVDGGESADEFPVIPDVPYAHPRAGSWFMYLPITAGDHVQLVFSERSLDVWRQTGAITSPLDLRHHDLSDAIAMPGNLYPDASALLISTANMIMGKADGSQIHIKPSGQVAIGSENPVDSAATALKVAAEFAKLVTVLTALGPDIIALYTLLGIPSPWATIALPAFLGTFPQDVGSTKVKVDP